MAFDGDEARHAPELDVSVKSALLILSEIRIYREGLRDVLRQHVEFNPVISAASRAEAWQQLMEQRLQIALIDSHCDDLLGLLAMFHSAPNPPKVVVLGIAEERETVLTLATEGIHGYLDKDAPLDDLVTTIQRARRNELACSPAIAGTLLQQVSLLSARKPARLGVDELTGRERELAQLIIEGLSNKEIAARLNISVATVKSHVHHILDKLGVHRRGKVREAIRGTTARPDGGSLRP